MKSRKERLGSGRKESTRRHGHVGCVCVASVVCVLLYLGGSVQVDLFASKGAGSKACGPARARFSERVGRRRGGFLLSTQRRFLERDEKFMYYAPHSGFTNQVMELKKALVVAKILNRTLVIPPVLDHHAAWLGSCPKRRVLRPHRLRGLVWARILDLMTNSSGRNRYTSIADIVDITSVTPSKVETIDLRVFLALWCGVDIKPSCGGTLCKTFAEEAIVWGDYASCAQSLNPMPGDEPRSRCVHPVQDDCTSTIWTYSPRALRDHKNASAATAVRRDHRVLNEWRAEKVNRTRVETADVRSSLGPHSAAGQSPVIAFGSLFTTAYKDVQSHIDITAPAGDESLDALIRALERLPFAPEIVAAGRAYVQEKMALPRGFFCAQLRLLDGQFKSHWNATFRALRTRLLSARARWTRPTPMPVFVMSDLPHENWTTTAPMALLLGSRNAFQVHNLDTRSELIQTAVQTLLAGEAGFVVGSRAHPVPELQQQASLPRFMNLPHVELAIEEVVCSCARLGFSGTHGSTIATHIEDLRATDICARELPRGSDERKSLYTIG